MLPLLYQTPYQNFRVQIERLEEVWANLGQQEAMARLIQIEAFFQEEILSLDETQLALIDPTHLYVLRAYPTEIHKQLQLLKMDLTFWFATRQPQKLALRSQQIRTRFSALNQYLDRVLQCSETDSNALSTET